MLYSLKEETGHERLKDKSTNKKKKIQTKREYPLPVPPPTPWYESTTPHLSRLPIIHNNNTMGTEFLVHIRQSNKCGSVRNGEIFTLGIWCRPLRQHPLPPARHEPHLLIASAQTINQKKKKEPRNQIQLSTNRIVLPWSTYTEP